MNNIRTRGLQLGITAIISEITMNKKNVQLNVLLPKNPIFLYSCFFISFFF